jgi:hypothetical protein
MKRSQLILLERSYLLPVKGVGGSPEDPIYVKTSTDGMPRMHTVTSAEFRNRNILSTRRLSYPATKGCWNNGFFINKWLQSEDQRALISMEMVRRQRASKLKVTSEDLMGTERTLGN